ncbi:MAG: pantoate--beta-alanine ligase [Bacteroidota bacterium]
MDIQIISRAHEMHDFAAQLIRENRTIGFVPTMGALHPGHISLIDKAKSENDVVVCSIFVNPTQFNDLKDLENYPRMPEADIALLKASGCEMVFLPTPNEIYPNGPALLDISFGGMENTMEGAFRPGHFTGVATVVNRLFEIVQPTNSYFGEKDFQQLAIIRKMAVQLHHATKIIGCPTLRESDGLAMSSRNLLLTAEQRKAAPLIYKALEIAQEFIPHQSPTAVIELVKRYIQKSPFLSVQYFQLVNPDTLEDITSWKEGTTVQGCIAVLTEGPRLIDNIRYTV